MTDVVLILLQSIADEADRSRLAAFYLQYYNLLRSKADRVFTGYNIPSSDLSEDMIQDAMARMIRNIDTVRSLSDAQLLAYGVKAVESCAMDYCRKAYSRQRLIEAKGILDGVEEEKVWEDTIDCFAEEDPLIRLGRALDSLPKRDHDILIYKYFLKYDDQKIAELLGIKENSVRMTLTRARNKVKEFWKGSIEKENEP